MNMKAVSVEIFVSTEGTETTENTTVKRKMKEK
jgi:hypothetical protein